MNKGKQQLPKKGLQNVFPEVVWDLMNRAEVGRETYGTYLQTHNGRSALVDAYHEALDLAVYLKQLLMEEE